VPKPFDVELQIRRDNTYGEEFVFRGLATPSIQSGVALAIRNFGGSPLVMMIRFDLERPNSAW